MNESIRRELETLFARRDDVAFAYLFGSAVAGRETAESDVDIAVYFRPGAHPHDGAPDIEATELRFSGESELWAAAERICGRSVDLVVLNRAPATVAAAALLTGMPLAVHDEATRLRFFLAVSTAAEDFRDFVEDYVRVKSRSRSLSAIDRGRLVRILDYLRDELDDAGEFAELDLQRYSEDRHLRRSVERWVENLVNSSIDVAKIVVASEGRPVPQTYRETMESLGTIAGFSNLAGRLADNTRVRNVLAHEYLDLRYAQVSAVLAGAVALYAGLIDATERWMDAGSRR